MEKVRLECGKVVSGSFYKIAHSRYNFLLTAFSKVVVFVGVLGGFSQNLIA